MLALTGVLSALSPVMVAAVGAYSAITVAKLTKMQKDIKTNHGTANIGEAVDIIRSRVDGISLSQDTMSAGIENLRNRSDDLYNRMESLENMIQDVKKSQDEKE